MSNKDTKLFIGRTYGEITTEEIGDTSFGYDCIFMSADLQKTFGEATAAEKNTVSHRSRAIEQLKKWLTPYNRNFDRTLKFNSVNLNK
jgi:XTP/dITP diphosphohydrolase